MIDSKDFERLASRYADGETSEGETASMRDFLIRDRRAQDDMQRVDEESTWISRGFRRPPEDISRLVIKVRQRNPHKRTQISPMISLALQGALLLAMVLSMFELNSELAPPKVTLLNTVGAVEVQRIQYLDPKMSVPLNRPFTTGEDSGAHVQIGPADSFHVAEQTALKVLSPRPGTRHVLSLEKGEVWCRFTDAQSGYAVVLDTGSESEDAKPTEVAGRRGEVNIGMGPAAVTTMLPRGSNLPAWAVIRLIDGVGSVRHGGTDHALTAGSVLALMSDGSAPVILADPDSRHYRRLRLNPDDSFKRDWDYLNPEYLPLSRDILTYDVWKRIVDIADALADARDAALERDGIAEIATFKAEIAKRITAARDADARRKPKPNDPDPAFRRSKFLTHSPRNEDVAKALSTLHTIAEDPDADETKISLGLLVAFADSVEEKMKGWESGDRAMWSLTVAKDSTQLLSVLAEMVEASAARMATAERRARSLEDARRGLGAEQLELDKANAEYARRIASELRDQPADKLDVTGPKRKAMGAQLAIVAAEVSRLESLRKDEELARQLSEKYLDQIDVLQRQRKPNADRRDELSGKLTVQQGLLAANTFNPLDLTQVESTIATTRKNITSAESDRDRLTQERDSLDAKAKAAAEALVAAKQLHDTRSVERDQADARLKAAVAAEGPLAELLTAATAAFEAREAEETKARQALDALPPSERAGSPEEAAFKKATANREAAAILLDTATQNHKTAAQELAAAEIANTAAIGSAAGAERALQIATETDAKCKADAADKQGELNSKIRTLKSENEALTEALADEQRLLKLRKEREDITARIAALETDLDPVVKEIARIDAAITVEQEGLRPHKERYDALVAERSVLPSKLLEKQKLESDINAMNAAEVGERTALASVVREQGAVTDAWLVVLSRLKDYGTILGGQAIDLPESLSAAISKRTEYASFVKPDGENLPSQYERVAELAMAQGTEVIAALSAHAKTLENANILALDSSRANDLSLAWMAAVAASVRSDALNDQQRRVEAFRRRVSTAHGFDNYPHVAGSVGAVLREAMIGVSRPGNPQLSDEQITDLLRRQWELFVDVTVLSELERAKAATTTPNPRAPQLASHRKCYLPLLREDPLAAGIRDLSSEWSSYLIKVIGEPAFKELAASRR